MVEAAIWDMLERVENISREDVFFSAEPVDVTWIYGCWGEHRARICMVYLVLQNNRTEYIRDKQSREILEGMRK